MKRINLVSAAVRRMAAKEFLSHLSSVRSSMLLFAIMIAISSCTKSDSGQSKLEAPGKERASVSAPQPLPGGKKYFTVTYGNLDAVGTTWVRLANWTFNDATGTVTSSFSNWDSNNRIGKTAVNSHLCTMPTTSGQQKSATCNVYAPTGWLSGSHASVPGSWSGSYTYNATTGALVISWSNGLSETWNISSPSSKLARVKFSSSTYAITHGRGYGSLKAFTGTASVSPGAGQPPTGGNYVPVASVPRVQYTGWYCWSNVNKSNVHTCFPTTGNTWRGDAMDFAPFTSNSTGAKVLHWRKPINPLTECTSGCNSGTWPGVIYHLGGNNTSRKMLINFFCACLTSNDNYPCYTGGLHPRAVMQIINDDGNLCGFVGVEVKIEPADAVAYQFNLMDWILPALDTP